MSDRPSTLGELRASGWVSRSVKDEVRRNAIARIRAGEPLFPGAAPPALWPFMGDFHALLAGHDLVMAETYPAEAMRHLGLRLPGSKRRQADRAGLAAPLLAAMDRLGAVPEAALAATVAEGFGADAAGEDRFDATIGVLGVLGAIVLAIFTGWAIAWIFTWIGTIAKSARSVQGMSMMILFPLTFLSNAFVPVDTLPSWLQTFVDINPVSHLVSATRDLANDAVITGQVGWTLLAGVVVIAIFAPLSVLSYRRHL